MQNTADNGPCLCVKKRYNRHGNDGFFSVLWMEGIG